VPDERAAVNHYIRVIDETGEDYLYPEKYFALIDLPEYAAEAMLDHATSLRRDVG